MKRSSRIQGSGTAGSAESISRARRWPSKIASATCWRGLTQSPARYTARMPASGHSSRAGLQIAVELGARVTLRDEDDDRHPIGAATPPAHRDWPEIDPGVDRGHGTLAERTRRPGRPGAGSSAGPRRCDACRRRSRSRGRDDRSLAFPPARSSRPRLTPMKYPSRVVDQDALARRRLCRSTMICSGVSTVAERPHRRRAGARG